MGCHSGGRVGFGVQDVLEDVTGAMDRGRIRYTGSKQAARKENRGERMEYNVARIGSEELGRKMLLLTITVSILPDLVLVSVAEC
jgi:hypothetical protein